MRAAYAGVSQEPPLAKGAGPKASGPFPCNAINQEFKQPGIMAEQELSRESVLSHPSNTWASQAENPAGNMGGPATTAGWVLNAGKTQNSSVWVFFPWAISLLSLCRFLGKPARAGHSRAVLGNLLLGVCREKGWCWSARSRLRFAASPVTLGWRAASKQRQK